MRTKTNLKAGLDVGQGVGRIVQDAALGARYVLNGVGQVVTPIGRDVERLVKNPTF